MKKSILRSIKNRQSNSERGDADQNPKQEDKARINWELIRQLRKMPKEKKDEWMDGKAAKVRAHYMKSRWEVYAPDPNSPNGIDMNNPNIRLEWLLQDPRIILRLVSRSSKMRQHGLEMLPEDLRPLYLYGTDPAGKRYTDIKPPPFMSTMKRWSGKVDERDFQEIDDETFAEYMDSLNNQEMEILLDDEPSDEESEKSKD